MLKRLRTLNVMGRLRNIDLKQVPKALLRSLASTVVGSIHAHQVSLHKIEKAKRFANDRMVNQIELSAAVAALTERLETIAGEIRTEVSTLRESIPAAMGQLKLELMAGYHNAIGIVEDRLNARVTVLTLSPQLPLEHKGLWRPRNVRYGKRGSARAKKGVGQPNLFTG
jgi:hypothetical protein